MKRTSVAPADVTHAGDNAGGKRWQPWFGLRFFAYLFVGSLAFSLGRLHERLEPLQAAIAAGAALGARALGTRVQAVGEVIAIGAEAELVINHECTGVFFLVIWAAFVLAYPASARQRLLGVAAGVAIIEAVNVARLATLAAIGARWPALFTYFHEYLWQGAFVLLIALLAVAWRERVERQHVVSG
ncbi:MAG: hypothetical protein HY699_16835 [Deltaproteobacteria bacterium]|nr:hypothetical protein [Deltaproteobacteria bacterium]